MRTIVFLLCTTVFSFTTKKSFGQDKVVITQDQLVTVDYIFKIIKKQTNYDFIYSKKLFKKFSKVQLTKGEILVSELLEKSLSGSNVKFEISGRGTIIIKENKETEPLAKSTKQQGIIITGKITDMNGQPLPGANVLEKGTANGTQADFDGQFSLEVANQNSTIIISYIGFSSKEILVGNQLSFEIGLDEDTASLDEVIIVGYGTQKKGNITGAITTVKSEQLNIAPVASTQNALIGQVPGLVSSQTSGEPGLDAADISIRGYGTALFLVDGVERQFNDIDPNAIESITVLKDASAAIYGARAGNGVILVTTKRGQIGKPELQFNSFYTLQGFTDFPKPYSAGEYSELWLESQKNDGIPEANWRFTEEDVQKYYDGTDPEYPSTDWFDFIVRNWSPQRQNTISMRGGNDKIKYYGLVGSLSQEGYIKSGDHKFKRYNIISNVDANITDDLTAQVNIAIIKSDLTAPFRSVSSGADERNLIFQDLFLAQPIFPTSYPDPTKIPFVNVPYSPIASSNIDDGGYRKTNVLQTNLAGVLEYKPQSIKGLRAKALLNFQQIDNRGKVWQKRVTTYRYDYDTDIYTPVLQGANTILSESSSTNTVLTGQFSLGFDTSFDKHNLSALLLSEIIDTRSEGINGSRTDFITTSIDYLFAGGTENQVINGSAEEFGRESYVGRINYDYEGKYLLTLSARYDASPKFAPENRWGFFPSISAGWSISKESFLEESNTVNNLKLRLAYSETGFDATGDFQYLSGYEIGTGALFGGSVVPGLLSTGIANQDITWEQMTNYNLGLDFALFKSKFYGELDLFYRLRDGILATRIESAPNTLGALLPAENLNSISNRGFELMLGIRGRNRDFSYNVQGNISWTRAKWEKFDEPEYTDIDDIRIRQQTGNWVGRQFGYKTDGLFTSQEEIDAHPLDQDNRGNETIRPGDIKYIDISGPDGVPDGILDFRDNIELGGTAIPQMFFGLSSQFTYKNFDANILFQGATKSTLRVNPARYLAAVGTSVVFENRWTPENNDADALFPIRSFRQANNFRASDFWTIDGSYLRLKTASIGYSLPSQVLKDNGIDSIRLSLSGTNLFTLSEASKYGIDPETPNAGAGFYYPAQRTISLGLNLTF